ncbi:hypothetical protein D7Z54_23505 [Salibacterium salarium]|uniref:Uncharacterized protein n=1 Tax=Salibacterium salarium TaxID=284579 RepID=A0A3R9WPR5_9BACI|nr:hypothetical protein [Salibacterium salarium]RSL30934.1 hypothetical protein D7Z54_23505 [Salibacterium salarium]
MFVSILEIMLVGLVTGAACVYTPHKQKMLSMLFILLFVCVFYLGFLLSSNQLIHGEGMPWVFAVLRIIIATGLTASAFICFIPYHGFFHSQSKYIWMAASSLFFFTGWHAGHWYSSLYFFIAFLIIYIIFFIGGNTIQSVFQFKMRQKSFVAFTPFLILLLFSIVLLL